LRTHCAEPRCQARVLFRIGVAQKLQRDMPRIGLGPAQLVFLTPEQRRDLRKLSVTTWQQFGTGYSRPERSIPICRHLMTLIWGAQPQPLATDNSNRKAPCQLAEGFCVGPSLLSGGVYALNNKTPAAFSSLTLSSALTGR
jgi:hypothetical protein